MTTTTDPTVDLTASAIAIRSTWLEERGDQLLLGQIAEMRIAERWHETQAEATFSEHGQILASAAILTVAEGYAFVYESDSGSEIVVFVDRDEAFEYGRTFVAELMDDTDGQAFDHIDFEFSL